MTRKVVVNLFITTIIAPVLMMSRHWGNFIDGLKSGVYRYEDARYETLWTYLKVILSPMWFFCFFFFILILVPFQVIKDWRYGERKKAFSWWVKCLILTGLIGFWMLFMPYFPTPDWQENLVVVGRILVVSIPVSVLLHFMVDRYTEK